MRYVVVVSLAATIAAGLSLQVVTEAFAETNSVRKPDRILGKPLHDQAKVKRYVRSVGSTKYIMRSILIYYELARKRDIVPDVLVAQAILEIGRARYGGVPKPWNMADIKKGGIVGDGPRDFKRPRTARQGVRMHINHMAPYTGKRLLGKPHNRFHDARAAQKSRRWWVRRISHLGGVWTTDSTYSQKIRRILNDTGKR